MSAKRDYYEVLGVSKTSSPDEIKSQYRKLALKFHPDRNKSPDAQEHFKEISEAYAILSDSEKKKVYDQFGHSGVDGRYSSEDIFQGAGTSFNDIFSDLFGRGGGSESIFENIFGGSRGFGGFRQQRGSDILMETSITLEEVLKGKKIEVGINKNVSCEQCKGSGCKPGTSKSTCSSCNGNGQVRKSRNMGFSTFVTVEPCRPCRGEGSIIEDPCKNCKGSGQVKGTKQVSFQIPPGIDHGDYTVPGEGESVPNGVNGDLIVRIRVVPHQDFKRDGPEIYYDAHISFLDAILGKKIKVPTLEDEEKISIQEGTQPNTIVKLKGKGLPRLQSRGRGDLFVRLIVDIPTKLSKSQKKLLEQFSKEE